jgi:hypothetical protein
MPAATKAGDAAPAAMISISEVPAETILVPIIGTAPLIVHNWSDKAKRQMLDAQQGRRPVRETRDPEADFEASRYRFADGGDGFPILGFKAATVGAARFFKTVKMTELRQFLFMHGELSADKTQLLARVEGTPTQPRMREDMVRVGMGTDLRYRAEFPEWRSTLKVTYVTSAIDRASVLSLINAGGMGVGVGEWRPEKKGQNGTYAVDSDRAVEVVER